MNLPARLEEIHQLHELYGQLTGQNLSLRFDRERLWFEFLRAGFTRQDLIQVVRYLQKEIRATRRNIGALKLSNLLQLDSFEEDLNISRVRLNTALPTLRPPPEAHSAPTPAEQEQGRHQALKKLKEIKRELGLLSGKVPPSPKAN